MKHILLLMLVVMGYGTLKAQTNEPKYVAGSITKDAILADIDEYASTIAKKHVRPFIFIKKQDFFDRIALIKDSAKYYNIDELLVKWLQVNAMIHDGHTYIAYENIVRDVFPFRCFWYEEGIFINGVSATDIAYQYSQVIAVNGLPIAEVVKRVQTITPDTTYVALKTNIQAYLFDPFVIHGLGISPSRAGAIYTLVNAKGDTVSVKPVAIDKRTKGIVVGADTSETYKAQELFICEYNDTGKYLYFKYGSCFEDKKHSVRNLIKKAKAEIEKNKPRKIVIDLRDNEGGYKGLLEPFIDYLAKTELSRKGEIYVLICRHTYSAGIFNAIYCKNHTYATIVGEATAGTVSFYAGTQFHALPATKLMFTYSTNYWESNENYSGSLQPDVPIPYTIAGHKQKIDAPLNYAVKH